MSYKPSYQGKLIDPTSPASADAMYALEDTAELPLVVEPVRTDTAMSSAVEEDPVARPAFEFLDLDEPTAMVGPEAFPHSEQPVAAVPAPCDTQAEAIFVDLDNAHCLHLSRKTLSLNHVQQTP